MGVVSTKLRKSAKGQPCTLRTPYCNYDTATTVLAHLPSEIKGMATKSDDFNACFACSACHEALDQHKLDEHAGFYALRALQRTLRVWVKAGLIVIPQDTHKPKTSTKIMPPRGGLYAASNNPEIRDASD